MGEQILVVDDDPQVLDLFSRILAEGGYSVRTEKTGKGALRLLEKSGPIELLILDLSMPKPDGFEILKAVRAHRPGLRVLVTSGFLGGPLLKASEFLGATASLAKTDAPKLLLKTVNDLLRS